MTNTVTEQSVLSGVLSAAADRVRACSDANLALRAGLNALEDGRHKLRQRLTGLREDESVNREGLRDALAIVGHLIVTIQGQVPISDGQMSEAKMMHAGLSKRIQELEEVAEELEPLSKAKAS